MVDRNVPLDFRIVAAPGRPHHPLPDFASIRRDEKMLHTLPNELRDRLRTGRGQRFQPLVLLLFDLNLGAHHAIMLALGCHYYNTPECGGRFPRAAKSKLLERFLEPARGAVTGRGRFLDRRKARYSFPRGAIPYNHASATQYVAGMSVKSTP